MNLKYRPRGTCSTMIDLDVEDGIVKRVKFTGGCNGNLQGISKLVEGMPAKEVIARLSGIRCGPRSTSCPDQLAMVLSKCVETE